jgi:hypothetical protein
MTQTIFSAGAMYGQSTASGVGPDQFGLLQSVSIEFARDTKDLFGEYQFPEVIASGQSRITGRAAFARVFGALYADLFFGESVSSNSSLLVVQNEIGTVAGAGSPATYSVTVANSADWTEDLGVYLSTGARLVQVASSPAAGQYSVAAGVYTFNVAQNTASVKISYVYSASSGKQFTINNQLMGVTPIFSIVLTNPGRTQSGSAPFSLVLNKCTASRLTLPTRMGEFAIPEFEFMGFADDSQVIGTMSTTE